MKGVVMCDKENRIPPKEVDYKVVRGKDSTHYVGISMNSKQAIDMAIEILRKANSVEKNKDIYVTFLCTEDSE